MKTYTTIISRIALCTFLGFILVSQSTAQATTNTVPIATDTIRVVCFNGKSTGINLAPSVIDPDGGALSFILGPPSSNDISTETTGRLSFNIHSISCVGNTTVFIRYFIQDTSSFAPTVLSANGVIKCSIIDSNFQSVNLPPIANQDYFLIDSGIASLINVVANDYEPNGQQLSYPKIITPSVLGSVTAINGNYLFTPNAVVKGIDSFQYIVCDTFSNFAPFHLCDTAWAYVHIRSKSANLQPSCADDFVKTKIDSTVIIDVLRNDFDQNGDTLQNVVLLTQPTNGIAQATINNQIRYTPHTTFFGFDTIVYSVCDLNSSNIVFPAMQCDTAKVVISVLNPLSAINAEVQNVSCYGVNDGKITPNISNGIAPYRYLWSNSAINDSILGLTPGVYILTVYDALCTGDMFSFQITEPTQVAISMADTQTLCHGATGTITTSVSGGTPVYVYTWSNGAMTPTPQITGNFPGKYFLTVTDSKLCTVTDSVYIAISTFQDSISLPTTDTLVCTLNSALLFKQTNTAINSAVWDFDDGSTAALFAPPKIFVTQRIYNVKLISTNLYGCADTSVRVVSVSNSCVYPGDANFDGITNNDDLLAIGLAYDSVGPVRPIQSIVYVAHYATDWSDTTTWNKNRKHADCDGNGIVNANDTLAIVQNWGLTHSKNNEQKQSRAGLPTLAVLLSPSSAITGDTVIASLQLGDINNIASNVYGLSFTFNYSSLVVDSTKTKIQFGSSWLGNTTDKISISKNFHSLNQLKTAVTRIDHTSRTGFGEIATVSLVINTDNIDGKNYADFPFDGFITDLKAIDATGKIIDLNEGRDSIIVRYTISSVQPLLDEKEIEIYPNPTANVFYIAMPKAMVTNIKLLNTVGNLVKETNQNIANISLSIDELANGIYFLEIKTERGQLIRKKVVVSR